MKGNWCKRSKGDHDGYKDYLIVRQNLTSGLFLPCCLLQPDLAFCWKDVSVVFTVVLGVAPSDEI